jgi:hypothetical protein
MSGGPRPPGYYGPPPSARLPRQEINEEFVSNLQNTYVSIVQRCEMKKKKKKKKKNREREREGYGAWKTPPEMALVSTDLFSGHDLYEKGER